MRQCRADHDQDGHDLTDETQFAGIGRHPFLFRR
jgi:hypothetical protein